MLSEINWMTDGEKAVCVWSFYRLVQDEWCGTRGNECAIHFNICEKFTLLVQAYKNVTNIH